MNARLIFPQRLQNLHFVPIIHFFLFLCCNNSINRNQFFLRCWHQQWQCWRSTNRSLVRSLPRIKLVCILISAVYIYCVDRLFFCFFFFCLIADLFVCVISERWSRCPCEEPRSLASTHPANSRDDLNTTQWRRTVKGCEGYRQRIWGMHCVLNLVANNVFLLYRVST